MADTASHADLPMARVTDREAAGSQLACISPIALVCGCAATSKRVCYHQQAGVQPPPPPPSACSGQTRGSCMAWGSTVPTRTPSSAAARGGRWHTWRAAMPVVGRKTRTFERTGCGWWPLVRCNCQGGKSRRLLLTCTSVAADDCRRSSSRHPPLAHAVIAQSHWGLGFLVVVVAVGNFGNTPTKVFVRGCSPCKCEPR
jgi:hypothetical protein